MKYFEARPGIQTNVLTNIAFVPHTGRYRQFMAHYPDDVRRLERSLVYYEVALDANHYFFYWSGVVDGKCTGYYTSEETDYEKVTDCRFPPQLNVVPEESSQDRRLFEGMFVGLVMIERGHSTRRYVINPNVRLGLPADGDITKKIESLVWH